MTIYLLVLVCIIFLLVGLAVRRRDHLGVLDNTDFMVANRKLPLWVACLTLAATWIGGGYINGTAEAVYSPEQGIVWCQAPWAYALSLVIGGLVFAGPMRARGYRTMLDLFEECHGSRVAGALFIPALIGDMFWTAAILSALGSTLGALFGVDASLAVVLSAGVVVAYTVWGGLWSVAISDVLQLACIFLGLALTVPFVIREGGGWQAMTGQYVQQFGERASLTPPRSAWSGSTPWAWQWLDSALLLICGGIPWQVYFQRVLACRSARAAIWMSVAAGLICLLMAVPPGIIGMAGATIDWRTIPAGPPETSAMVLPHVLRYALPTVVSLSGLIALVAAVMSSMDSSILSSASLFAWNVYRPLTQTHEDAAELRLVLRIGVVVLGSVAVLLALSVNSVYQLWYLSSDLVYVILFPQLVTALFYPRVKPAGAIAGATMGVTLRLGMACLMSDAIALPVGLQTLRDRLTYVPWRTCAMLVSLFSILIVSRMSEYARPRSETNEPSG